MLALLARATLVVALCLTTLTARSQGTSPAPALAPVESTVSAAGKARVFRTPDFVDVTLGVLVQDATASAAQYNATQVMERVVASIKTLKLAGEELQTGTVDLSPRYPDYQSHQERKVIGYNATISMRVRTTDLKSVAKIIDAALGAGANLVHGVDFQIKDALEAREEALKLATKAAKRKATVMAEALDLKLGRVTGISEQTHAAYYGRGQAQMSNRMGESSQEPSDSEAIQPGKIEIWAEVTLSVTLVGK